MVIGPEALPPDVRADLRSGAMRRIVVVGQGTAAVAGQSLAAALDRFCPEARLRVEAMPATELSGFGLRPSMADTLVVAISQSGTTTDTNRTVDLVRSRAPGGGHRQPAGQRPDRQGPTASSTPPTGDVEMSVASTKAFYSQIAPACPAAAIAEVGGHGRPGPPGRAAELPGHGQVTARRRHRSPRPRPGPAVLGGRGNGANRIAAAELRHVSEFLLQVDRLRLDRGQEAHRPQSSEPLIVVCAAGLEGSTADDVAKEVAIYRAHKAAPVVIATEGQSRYASALYVLPVPVTHPALAFVLSAMAGHLFGYEAALAIDALARPLREARAAIEAVVTGGAARPAPAASPPGAVATRRRATTGGQPGAGPTARSCCGACGPTSSRWPAGGRRPAGGQLRRPARGLDRGAPGRAARCTGVVPLDAYQVDQGKVGTPAVVLDDLTAALTQAIEELTRPIDAIKHQAKTVTVGISRTDESLLEVPLVREVLGTGAHRDGLSYRTLRTLADISPAIAEVVGHTRYQITGKVDDGATITVVDRGGIARDLPSRTERSPELRGTKRRVAAEGEVLVARGRRDGRPIVIVPEVKDGEATGITLLHVRFADRLPVDTARGVLQGYRNRYSVLRDAVRENRADLPRGPAGRDPSRRAAHQPIQPARRPVYSERAVDVGVGVDLVEVDRMPHRGAHAASSTGSTAGERDWCRRVRPGRAVRRPVRRRGRAEGRRRPGACRLCDIGRAGRRRRVGGATRPGAAELAWTGRHGLAPQPATRTMAEAVVIDRPGPHR